MNRLQMRNQNEGHKLETLLTLNGIGSSIFILHTSTYILFSLPDLQKR